jgi:hypothetical protein
MRYFVICETPETENTSGDIRPAQIGSMEAGSKFHAHEMCEEGRRLYPECVWLVGCDEGEGMEPLNPSYNCVAETPLLH